MSRGTVRRVFRISAVMTAAVLWLFVTTSAASPETEMRQAAERFYRALNTNLSGDVGPMLEIWSHGGDVTNMGPFGGLLVGWQAVRAEWERLAAVKSGNRVQLEDSYVVASGQLGVLVGHLKVTAQRKGESVMLKMRVTDTFRRENGSWKVIGHHQDLFPWADGSRDTRAPFTDADINP